MPNPIYSFHHPESGVTYEMWYSPDKIGRAFASGKLYERPFLDWIYAQNFQGTALDVGANIGNHTLWMHLVCRLNVVAFEPVLPHVVRANALINGAWDDGIEVRDYALGDATGVGFHRAKGVVHQGESLQSTDESFQIKRLDDVWVPGNVSFVKIDVEGMEASVLRGGVGTLALQRPVIATEEWDTLCSEAVAAVLQPLGYTKHETFGGRGKAPMQIWRP